MFSRWSNVVAVWLILTAAFPRSASPVPARETEEQLLARLRNEPNPVKRAKFEIRLGRIKLLQAIEAYNKGDVEPGGQLLKAYLERMQSSWRTLRGSGRNAAKHPQGFKELEFALREHARLVEDLARRVPYFDRGPIEAALAEIEQVRDEVLRALFPAIGTPARSKKPPGAS